MTGYYLFLLIVIFLFGIYNLHRRVKTDALVYLHPAFSNAVATRWKIMLVAAAGVVIGVLLSQNMLVIPQKVIFNPGVFVFNDIIVIFLAMMIADVIILYIFRNIGLSSASIIMVLFGLLGSSVAVSLVRIRSMRKTFSDLILFINPGDVLQIIGGIFVSVIIAFAAGVVVQFLVRLLFTFRYRLHFRRYGYLFGAILITLVFYFIMINGSGLSFLREFSVLPDSILRQVWKYYWIALVISLVFWYLLLLVMRRFLRKNVLKTIILIGIFALALTMTTNETVNYAGVPLTGLASFNEWFASGAEGELFKVDFLTKNVHTPNIILALVGLVVALVLVSGKTPVKDPEIVLLPNSGSEDDQTALSLKLARRMTRLSFFLGERAKQFIPGKFLLWVQSRFDAARNERTGELQVISYDAIRLVVNLYLSVALISMATSLTLPVSTVFVVMMVMLGTSFSDRGWGRENAVQRFSGIFAFLGNWAFTAFLALMLSAFVAWIIIVGGKPVTITMIFLTTFLVVREQVINRRNFRKISEEEELINDKDEIEKSIDKCSRQVVKTIISANKIFSFTMDSFLNEDRAGMHRTLNLNEEINKKSRKQKDKIIQTISSVKQLDVDSGYFYIQINDYQREIAHSLNLLTVPLHEHLENQYKTFNASQVDDIRMVVSEIDTYFNFALHIVKEEKFESLDEWMNQKISILETLEQIEKGQIARIKNKEVDVRNSLLFFRAMAEIKNLLAHVVSLLKSYHGFIMVNRKSG